MINELERTKAKILGVLIKDARLHAGRSAAACAQVLDIDERPYLDCERGDKILSLPELEVLALYLQVPLAHFWENKAIDQALQTEYDELLALRRQVIGGQLRRARIEADRSLEAVAGEANVDLLDLEGYEAGERPVPLLVLERVGKYLGVPLDHFMDLKRGPLAAHEQAQKETRRIQEMPDELRAFVSEPVNRSYLETALHLSHLDANRLRQVAESILEITL
jgi:transcriptional regulator with XRE-family HTH domain